MASYNYLDLLVLGYVGHRLAAAGYHGGRGARLHLIRGHHGKVNLGIFCSVFRIRIRLDQFQFGIPDPDPLYETASLDARDILQAKSVSGTRRKLKKSIISLNRSCK